MADMASRSPLKLVMMIRKPWPSSPSRWPAGTRTLSKRSCAVSEHHQPIFPARCGAGRAHRPAPRSSRCRAAPHRGLLPGIAGAHGHRDPVGPHAGGDEHFSPLMTHSPPSSRAVVRRLATSEPPPGFGDGQRGDLLATQHRRDHLLLQCGRTMAQHRRQADVVAEQAGQHTAAAAVARQRQRHGVAQRKRRRCPPSASG
jgi:hypothetical protein